ncbi:hypothetical protein [Thermoactinospora rubra]|uniref:hypothetical protein n=1 Tax=Thermoactinospora rubra TaxID=1088767 RepID=UPI000A121D14|nr:hypothetical protein [Thermoactinospora rubra]
MDAAVQRACDARRHRPLIKPVRAYRDRVWSEADIIEVWEDGPDQPDLYEDGVHERLTAHGLVAAIPGHLAIYLPGEVCLTAEAYRRRPPLETKGWDRVVELDYHSPTGLIEPRPAGREPLPNLAFHGKGDYRVRVHHREPRHATGDPPHMLIMVFPVS